MTQSYRVYERAHSKLNGIEPEYHLFFPKWKTKPPLFQLTLLSLKQVSMGNMGTPFWLLWTYEGFIQSHIGSTSGGHDAVGLGGFLIPAPFSELVFPRKGSFVQD